MVPEWEFSPFNHSWSVTSTRSPALLGGSLRWLETKWLIVSLVWLSWLRRVGGQGPLIIQTSINNESLFPMKPCVWDIYDWWDWWLNYLQVHPYFRWVNGKGDALKQSSAYPTNLGRAFALAYDCLRHNITGNQLEATIRRFVIEMAQSLPEPGKMSPEESQS